VIGRGNEGVVHELPGRPDMVVKVFKKETRAAEQARTLEQLNDLGVPTPYQGLVQWTDAAGNPGTGVLLSRMEGSSVLTIIDQADRAMRGSSSWTFGNTFDPSRARAYPDELRLVNETTVAQLRQLRDTAERNRMIIFDPQIMVSPDGSIQVYDPVLVMTGAREADVARGLQELNTWIARLESIAAANRR
jgi:hypothetical protein